MIAEQDIEHFLQSNDEDLIFDYYNKLHEKLKEISNRINRITIYLLILGGMYFLLSPTIAIQIGPFSTDEFKYLPLLIPVAFTYCLLEFAIVSSHKAELIKLLKHINKKMYIQRANIPEPFDDANASNFLRLLLPFSVWTDSTKYNEVKGATGCLSFLFLYLPLLVILVPLPFIIEIYMIKDLLQIHWETTFGKASTIATFWLFAATIYFYLQLFKKADKIAKIENQ